MRPRSTAHLSKKTEQRLAQRRRARAERRNRDALGSQDAAHYRCACGHEFTGDVSTHVACPRCGTEQAW